MQAGPVGGEDPAALLPQRDRECAVGAEERESLVAVGVFPQDVEAEDRLVERLRSGQIGDVDPGVPQCETSHVEPHF